MSAQLEAKVAKQTYENEAKTQVILIGSRV